MGVALESAGWKGMPYAKSAKDARGEAKAEMCNFRLRPGGAGW